MFGGVDAEHEHEILVAKRAQPLPFKRDHGRSFEEVSDVEADRHKTAAESAT